MAKGNVLKASSNAELLSYIINQDPILKADLDLPVQGKSVKPYGKLIVDNDRYKNAFINTMNVIGLTIIKRNPWQNPWLNFTQRGTLERGQQIRELIMDLAKINDYNKNYDNKEKFLETTVPDIYQYVHELNFQKFYSTTINDEEILMAFANEEGDGLLELATEIATNLYETWNYDKFLVDKYQLCRRIVDGTIPVKQIENFDNKDPRDILAEMKAVSNKMTFKRPFYNPAGVRKATPFDEQYLMLDADREAINTTNVLATSYFRDDAQTKTNLALIDAFYETDEERLAEVLEDAYIPFTENEKTQLKNVIGLIISEKWFMDYNYAFDTKQTEFQNPASLDKNLFLHVWHVFSTSPFENCVLFTTGAPSVTSVTVTPATATVTKGQELKLSAIVETVNFANKSVIWSTDNEDVKIGVDGKLTVPSTIASETVITVTATSIFDNTVSGTATITVA